MTSDRELEQQLEELAGLVKPAESVVDSVMQRIAAEPLTTTHPPTVRLVPDVPTDEADDVARAGHPMTEPSRGRCMSRRFATMLHSRRFRWAIAGVVAAATVLAVGLWPDKPSHRSGPGIIWADVLPHLEAAQTMVAWLDQGGTRMRLFAKAGNVRLETFGSSAASQPGQMPSTASSIMIATELLDATWDVRTKTAVLSRQSRPAPVTDASMYWQNLRRIGADQANRVGEEAKDGVATIVFEAPLAALLSSVPHMMDSFDDSGIVRVWVSTASDLPVGVEMRYRYRHIPQVQQIDRMSQIEWNVPLEDRLFEPPVFDATWQIQESRDVYFERHDLRPDVTLSLASENGGPVLASAADVQQISGGREDLTVLPGRTPSRIVWIQWTPAAAERIFAHMQSHPGDTLLLDFNGETTTRINPPPGGLPKVAMLDIEPLGVSLEAFEERFLDAGTPAK